MFTSRRFLQLGAVLTLGGCVAVPPGPAFTALPPQGKDLAVFQRDDAACRQYAQSGPASPALAASGATPKAAAPAPDQSPDLSYAQCMAAHGETIQPAPAAYAGDPAYAYPTPYPYAYPYAYPFSDPFFVGGFYGGCCFGGFRGGYGYGGGYRGGYGYGGGLHGGYGGRH